MKKMVIVGAMVLILFLGTCIVHANEMDHPVVEDDNYDYVVVNSTRVSLDLSGNNAVCSTTVNVNGSSNANKVVLTVNYVKSNGVSVGTESVTVYRSNNSFTGITTKKLTSHGRYYAKVAVKVYYNSQLIESFYLRSRDVVY